MNGKQTESQTLWSTVPSPVGPLTLIGGDGYVTGLYMRAQRHRPPRDPKAIRDDDAFADAARQLGEYFAGDRARFELDIRFEAGTDFQHRVWRELRRIPFGQTRTYAELAARVGKPNASRGVGLANGRNPVSIIVPCHRVIGSDGSLTGYGGGLKRKRLLLGLEGALPLPRRADS